MALDPAMGLRPWLHDRILSHIEDNATGNPKRLTDVLDIKKAISRYNVRFEALKNTPRKSDLQPDLDRRQGYQANEGLPDSPESVPGSILPPNFDPVRIVEANTTHHGWEDFGPEELERCFAALSSRKHTSSSPVEFVEFMEEDELLVDEDEPDENDEPDMPKKEDQRNLLDGHKAVGSPLVHELTLVNPSTSEIEKTVDDQKGLDIVGVFEASHEPKSLADKTRDVPDLRSGNDLDATAVPAKPQQKVESVTVHADEERPTSEKAIAKDGSFSSNRPATANGVALSGEILDSSGESRDSSFFEGETLYTQAPSKFTEETVDDSLGALSNDGAHDKDATVNPAFDRSSPRYEEIPSSKITPLKTYFSVPASIYTYKEIPSSVATPTKPGNVEPSKQFADAVRPDDNQLPGLELNTSFNSIPSTPARAASQGSASAVGREAAVLGLGTPKKCASLDSPLFSPSPMPSQPAMPTLDQTLGSFSPTIRPTFASSSPPSSSTIPAPTAEPRANPHLPEPAPSGRPGGRLQRRQSENALWRAGDRNGGSARPAESVLMFQGLRVVNHEFPVATVGRLSVREICREFLQALASKMED
ncbi:hypothetical protein HK405_012475 [Cladochytrium tenue]|nr:hypothetical protein HK405_012475 [Cladochytrium tenue]